MGPWKKMKKLSICIYLISLATLIFLGVLFYGSSHFTNLLAIGLIAYMFSCLFLAASYFNLPGISGYDEEISDETLDILKKMLEEKKKELQANGHEREGKRKVN